MHGCCPKEWKDASQGDALHIAYRVTDPLKMCLHASPKSSVKIVVLCNVCIILDTVVLHFLLLILC